MKCLRFLAVAVGLSLSGLVGHSVANSDYVTEYYNNLTDELIDSMAADPKAYKLEPYDIDDMKKTDYVWWVKYELELLNGKVYGAQTMFRNGNVTMTNVGKKTYNFTCGIGFKCLNYSSDYTAKVGFISGSGSVYGEITDLFCNMSIIANMTNPSATTAYVDKLTLKQAGDMDMCAKTGSEILDSIVDTIIDLLNALFKSKINTMMEKNFLTVLNNTMTSMTFNL